jgi:glycerol-3-phosphate acyltransferase PlsY
MLAPDAVQSKRRKVTDYLLLVPLGYLLGSIPFGLIASQLLKGVDLREHGSGRTGMTNVMRTVGTRAAIVVLVLDMGKSVVAVVLARVFSDSPGVEPAAALAAIVGHNWPVFVGFKGGRGIATGWGGLFILSPLSGLVATAIGAPTVAIWRYMSLGSILGAGSGAVTLVILSVIGFEPLAYAWYGLIAGPLVIIRHRDNIQRLIRGEERKLSRHSAENMAQHDSDRDKGLRWRRSV